MHQSSQFTFHDPNSDTNVLTYVRFIFESWPGLLGEKRRVWNRYTVFFYLAPILRCPYPADLKTEFMVWPLAFIERTRYETLPSILKEFRGTRYITYYRTTRVNDSWKKRKSSRVFFLKSRRYGNLSVGLEEKWLIAMERKCGSIHGHAEELESEKKATKEEKSGLN